MFPEKVAQWFSLRGINEETLKRFNIYWNGREIVIPIKDEKGKTLFNKYRRDPESNDGPKYRYEKGGNVTLYNPKGLDAKQIIVAEGELEVVRLGCMSHEGISSTGGATSFQKEWIPLLDNKEVYICLDNDTAGIKGAIKLYTSQGENSHFKLVQFPAYFLGKDITDYLQHHTADEFQSLLDNAIQPPFVKEEDILLLNKYIEDCEKIRRELIRKDLTTGIIDAYIEYLLERRKLANKKKKKKEQADDIKRVHDVPIDNFIDFSPAHFAKRCIWHSPDRDQKTPSLFYYKKSNRVYCFSCGVSADVISVVRKIDNCTFLEAITTLKKYL